LELMRRTMADVTVAQLRAIDPAWEPKQRDCAGLVRFVYRQAVPRQARGEPLFRDRTGAPTDFADAQTLVHHNFTLLGRDLTTRERLRTGDLVVFRQARGDEEPAYHLMLVLAPKNHAHAHPLVVYHPGEAGASLRTGTVRALDTTAPIEWRPLPQNTAFLGFYRFKEWLDE
jgi:uncharacterized protein YfaT (DUF1175 family)